MRFDPRKSQYGGFVGIWFYCTLCKRFHKKSSGIGQAHRQFEGDPPPLEAS